jgi:hypothetical protein
MAYPFLAMPLHDPFACHYLAAKALWFWPTNRYPKLFTGQCVSSLLPDAFNQLWQNALELQDEHGERPTHFVMLHGDIVPEKYWVDILIEEMERHNCQIISAVVPIKNNRDETSTAVGQMIGRESRWRRLQLSELAQLPETFSTADVAAPGSADKLLVNTGVMACDIRGPWARELARLGGFRLESYMVETEGKFRSVCLPEDWLFSWDAQRLGCKVMATTKISLLHHGNIGYSNRLAE